MDEDKTTDAKHWARVHASWNAFYEKHGCFADEFNEDYRPTRTDESEAEIAKG